MAPNTAGRSQPPDTSRWCAIGRRGRGRRGYAAWRPGRAASRPGHAACRRGTFAHHSLPASLTRPDRRFGARRGCARCPRRTAGPRRPGPAPGQPRQHLMASVRRVPPRPASRPGYAASSSHAVTARGVVHRAAQRLGRLPARTTARPPGRPRSRSSPTGGGTAQPPQRVHLADGALVHGRPARRPGPAAGELGGQPGHPGVEQPVQARRRDLGCVRQRRREHGRSAPRGRCRGSPAVSDEVPSRNAGESVTPVSARSVGCRQRVARPGSTCARTGPATRNDTGACRSGRGSGRAPAAARSRPSTSASMSSPRAHAASVGVAGRAVTAIDSAAAASIAPSSAPASASRQQAQRGRPRNAPLAARALPSGPAGTPEPGRAAPRGAAMVPPRRSSTGRSRPAARTHERGG